MQIQNFHAFISAFSPIISCINICRLKNLTHSCNLKIFIYAFSKFSCRRNSKFHSSFQKAVRDPLGMTKVTFSHYLFKKMVHDSLSMAKVSFSPFFSKKVVRDPLSIDKVSISHAFIYTFSYTLTYLYMRSQKKKNIESPTFQFKQK